MIDHLLDLYATLAERGGDRRPPRAEALVPRAPWRPGRRSSSSRKPTGMLDAILLAHLESSAIGPVACWMTWCDQVAIRPNDAGPASRRRRADRRRRRSCCRRAVRPDPYIHFARDASGRIARVLHRREGDAMPDVGESMPACSTCRCAAYLELAAGVRAAPAVGAGTGERNFLPFVAWVAARGPVVTVPCTEPRRGVGINTPEELARVEALPSRRASIARCLEPSRLSSRRTTRSGSSARCSNRFAPSICQSLGVGKQVIVVDDHSRDRTSDDRAGFPGVTLQRLRENSGKGRAVRAGMELATGDYLIIQDADLEYDPHDYMPMMRAMLDGRADVVYGSRYMGRGRHAEPVAGRVPGRAQPQPGRRWPAPAPI